MIAPVPRHCVLIFTLLATTLAAGCLKLDRPRLTVTHYGLKDPILASNEVRPWAWTSAQGCILKVRQVRVDALYSDPKFVYRLGENEWSADYYHTFLIPPGQMLTGIVETYLARTGDSRSVKVVPASSVLSPSHTLETTVRELYADYSDPGQPRAVLAAEFLLIDERAAPDAGSIVLHRTWRESVALESNQPAALVSGWNAALKGILLSLGTELQKLAPTSDPSAQ
jgi:hypothetical protein